MIIFKRIRIVKLLILVIITLSLLGCENYPTKTSKDIEETAKSYNFNIPARTPVTNSPSGVSLNEPLVTTNVPDNNGYPFFYGVSNPEVHMVKNTLYYKNKAIVYESSSDDDVNWKTNALELEHISDLLTDDNYLYCLDQFNKAYIYDPATHATICSKDIGKEFPNYSNFTLECAGNNKCFFSALGKDNFIIFSLDQLGTINIIDTDNDYVLQTYYCDSDYFVYSKSLPDNTDFHVYAVNNETGSTNEIYDKKIFNQRAAPAFRWNDSIVLITFSGIVIADPNGEENYREFSGNRITSYGFYQNKVYFEGQQLTSFDISTGVQKTYDFGSDSDFSGNINVYNGKILLYRKENIAEYATIYVINVPE